VIDSDDSTSEPEVGSQPQQPVEIFGKHFWYCDQTAQCDLVALHPDYPLIGDSHRRSIEAHYRGSGRIAMSGCEAAVHPYRLHRTKPSGELTHLIEVSAEIRGRRQNYPCALRFVPALIFIAAGRSWLEFDTPAAIDFYRMDAALMLDRQHPIECLLIHEHQRSGDLASARAENRGREYGGSMPQISLARSRR
jgi:hypothetical protein